MANPFADLPPDTPIYKLIAPCYLEDDTLHATDEEIAYLGTPNEFMAPMNEAAQKKMGEFLGYLDDCARAKAEAMGRAFNGRPRDLGDQIDEAMGDVKRAVPKVDIVTSGVTTPIPQRPDLIPVGKRRGRPPKVLATHNPAAPAGSKKTVLGTSHEHAAGGNSAL